MRRCHSTAGSTFFVAIANDLQYGMEMLKPPFGLAFGGENRQIESQGSMA
jgi:hypothetical protein